MGEIDVEGKEDTEDAFDVEETIDAFEVGVEEVLGGLVEGGLDFVLVEFVQERLG